VDALALLDRGYDRTVRSLREVYVRQAAWGDGREHWSGPPEMVERIAAVIHPRRSDRVLDVGCGLGGPARRLADHVGCKVIGVDVVEEVVRAAARRDGAGIRYVVARADGLPVTDACVDQVWCLGTLAHLSEITPFARELRRVLRPGGRAAITEAFWEGERTPRFLRTAPQPWRPVMAPEAASSLAAAGLVDVSILPWPGEGIPAPPPSDPALAADLADGRLVPRLVVARRP
jgi:SAM-dependent methyltransferase